MKKKYTFLFLSFFIIFSFSSFSQSKKLNYENFKTQTIENQLQTILTKSNSYQNYKVIKKNWLEQLSINLSDTIHLFKTQLTTTQNLLNEQKTNISQLKENLQNINAKLAHTIQEKNSISLLGIQTDKSTYNKITWLIILILLILFTLFVLKFKRSNLLTKQANKLLKETEHEFELHRTKALEREQKVMRKLQDEINKHKDESNS